MYSEYNSYSPLYFSYIPSFSEEVKEMLYIAKIDYKYNFLLRVNYHIFEK